MVVYVLQNKICLLKQASLAHITLRNTPCVCVNAALIQGFLISTLKQEEAFPFVLPFRQSFSLRSEPSSASL